MAFQNKINSCFPLNVPSVGSSYQPNQQVEFRPNCENKRIKAGSWSLNGSAKLLNREEGNDVYFSPSAGLHGMISSIITTTFGSVRENILNYGRLCAQEFFYETSETRQGELNLAMQGIFPNNNTVLANAFAVGNNANYINFSLPLNFCLNKVYNMSGEAADCPFSKLASGQDQLGITIRISPLSQMLFGADADTIEIELTNLLLTWDEEPDDGKNEKLMMEIVNNTRNTANSNYFSISTFLSMPSTSVSISFIPLAYENDQLYDYYEISTLPQNNGQGTQSLELLLDDQASIIKYKLNTSQQERIYSNMLMLNKSTTSLTKSDWYQSELGEMYSIAFPVLLAGHKLSIIVYNPYLVSNNGYACYAFFKGYADL
jgi:hypothetical protein